MIDAVIEQVGHDWDRVTSLLQQAAKHRKSAGAIAGDDPEGSYLLFYSAVHKGLTAMLLADGDRVSSGERGHKLLIEETKSRLGSEHAQTFTRIDRARRKRNDVAYESEEVSTAELKAIATDVNDALNAVQAYVQERLP